MDSVDDERAQVNRQCSRARTGRGQEAEPVRSQAHVVGMVLIAVVVVVGLCTASEDSELGWGWGCGGGKGAPELLARPANRARV